MRIEEAIYAELIADPAVSGLVQQRVMPQFAPVFAADASIDSVRPHIIYMLRSADVSHGMSPRVSESWEIICCAGSYDEMLALADAVITLFNQRSGMLAGESGAPVISCLLQGYDDDASSDLGVFARRLSFAVQRVFA